jgi:hypothetical protein
MKFHGIPALLACAVLAAGAARSFGEWTPPDCPLSLKITAPQLDRLSSQLNGTASPQASDADVADAESAGPTLAASTDLATTYPVGVDPAAPADIPAVAPQPEPFAQGSWVAQVYGATTVSDRDPLYQAHAGVGYFVFKGHSLNLETNLGYVEGFAGGVTLLIRSHWIRQPNWSLYIDGGAGVLWTQDPFPAGGTRWNFTPQAGVGFTRRLSDSTHLMAGARWYHASNANWEGSRRNPGYNGVMIYAGLMFTF